MPDAPTVRRLNLDSWPRRAQYEYFRDFDKPFFNLCAEVDVTALVELGRRAPEASFTAATLYLCLRAVNAVEELRLRLVDGGGGHGVEAYDRIHGAVTVLREDRSFGFAYFEFLDDFNAFRAGVNQEIERVKGTHGLEDRPEARDVIHFSVIPWVRFSSFSHARRWGTDDSIPKIVFGRRTKTAAGWRMPVSVEVHHALADGLQVGELFRHFEEGLASAESALSIAAGPPRAAEST